MTGFLSALAAPITLSIVAIGRAWGWWTGRRIGRWADRHHADAGCPVPCNDKGVMRGHPERVQELGDPAADEAYGEITEALLDDGMAEIAEETGWMR